MKKILLAILLMPLFSIAQGVAKKAPVKPPVKATVPFDGLVIKGNLQGVKENTEVALKNLNSGQTIATGKVVKGAFTLKGKLNEADLIVLNFNGYPQPIEMFVFNEVITVSGNISDIQNVKITGSQTQADFELFKSKFNPLFEKLQGLATSINAERDPQKRDSMMKLYYPALNNVLVNGTDFIKERPASPVSSLALFAISRLFPDQSQLSDVFAQIQPAARKNAFGRDIESRLVGMVGSQALDFTQKDVDGNPVSLASFRGKYVLVDFWASWCRPCRAENPNVVTAYNTFKNKNFTVLGVSLDQAKPSWVEAIKADNLTWTHVSDLQYWSNAVAQLYHIGSIPANLLIDPNGKIIARDIRGEELQRKLQEVLK